MALRPRADELSDSAAAAPAPPRFSDRLRAAHVGVVAEIKRRSPSKGEINPGLSAPEQARAYEAGGAAAISVLTEPDSFGGSTDDLLAAREAVRLPLLRKDFLIDPLQVIEARALGASAVLLIARALPAARLAELAAVAREWGLDALVEVRTEGELKVALATGAAAVGVNNRDLETLATDDAVSARLIPLVPPDRVAIYESGVRDVADVERAAAAGADAVLVGTSISRSGDPAAAVAGLRGVARRPR
jgi:indole-3-glycerol phosphate synthase